MIRQAFFCGLVALAGVVTAAAEEFPLTFRTIPAKDVMSFPGGSGTFGQMRLVKPDGLKQEPKAVSRHPLYGECSQGSGGGVLFRLDESKGDGKGYDQLIVDFNHNGDLTDDAPVGLAIPTTERKTSASAQRQRLFGPIEAPAGKLIAGGRPIYFAQAYINDLSAIFRSGKIPPNVFAGQLRLKAGWYVDTTVALNGLKQKVGVIDGDNNLRLGDGWKPETYHDAEQGDRWSFAEADYILVDVDGSGTFESDTFNSESRPFGPVIYFGATPYKVALAPDRKSLRVEPWAEALAEVSLQPHGEQVHGVMLAWERPNKQWQLIRPGVANGKIKVPVGNYRLYACELLGKGAARDQVMAGAEQNVLKKPFSFAAAQPNTLRCGAPLEIKVTGEKRKPEPWELNGGDLRNPPLASDSGFVLSINASVRGVDGEVYSECAKGEKFEDEPPKPAFTITDAGGKKVADGKLEFG